MDGSVVVSALVRNGISSEKNSNQPSAFSARNDLTNCARYECFSFLGRNWASQVFIRLISWLSPGSAVRNRNQLKIYKRFKPKRAATTSGWSDRAWGSGLWLIDSPTWHATG